MQISHFPDVPVVRRPWYLHLYAQVLLAIIAGVALGHFAPHLGEAMKPVGDAFIKAVKMVIAPVRRQQGQRICGKGA
jgi:aerobic C4-dicarboxylate transport protein